MSYSKFDIIELAKLCGLSEFSIGHLAGLLSKMNVEEFTVFKLLIDKSTKLAYETGCVQVEQQRNADSWGEALKEEDQKKSLKFF